MGVKSQNPTETKLSFMNIKFVGRLFEAKNTIKANSNKKEKEAISNICPMAKLNFAAIMIFCKFILRIHAQLY